MTDLKAAAERLRRIKAGDNPASVYAESLARLKANHDRRNDEMKLRAYFDEREIIRELVTNDESELSDAYLAERPADGETEITPENLEIARECLRKIWQIFDHGGHSMGRSMESALLEIATTLIPHKGTYSRLADKDPSEFLRIATDAKHAALKAGVERQHRKIVAMDQAALKEGA